MITLARQFAMQMKMLQKTRGTRKKARKCCRCRDDDITRTGRRPLEA